MDNPQEEEELLEAENVDNVNLNRSVTDTRMFDSFDMDTYLMSPGGGGHNFSLFISPSLPLSQVTSESSVFRKLQTTTPARKIYCGLLADPDYEAYLPDDDGEQVPKYSRPVTISNTFHTHSIPDFLALGPKTRTSRRINRKSRRTFTRSSKQLRTFHARLEAFRPFFEDIIATAPEWSTPTNFKDIVSVSSMSTEATLRYGHRGEDAAAVYSWDNMQGIGFREYPSVVLIGYTCKIAPVSGDRVRELCANIGVLPIPLQHNLSPGLFLEDETARIQLELSACQDKLKFEEIVSGVPVAIKGVCAGGKLWVENVLFATPLLIERPIQRTSNNVDMVFVSGLNMGKPFLNKSALALLFEYLQGTCGSEAEQGKVMIRSTRVFFLGNLFHKPKQWNPDQQEELIAINCDIADELDYYLDGLTQTMEVFIIPGENDPTHKSSLPQPPIHKQLFSNSVQRNTLHALTNPSKVHLGVSKKSYNPEDDEEETEHFISLVLTSGANVKETMDHCEIECPLEMCTKLMEWSHLHPTSVDDGELAEEIFTLTTLPHLFVVGGLTDYKVKEWNGVKVVGVPSFSSTGIVMVLNKNGEVLPMRFNIST